MEENTGTLAASEEASQLLSRMKKIMQLLLEKS